MPDKVRCTVMKPFNGHGQGDTISLDSKVAEKWAGLGLVGPLAAQATGQDGNPPPGKGKPPKDKQIKGAPTTKEGAGGDGQEGGQGEGQSDGQGEGDPPAGSGQGEA